MPATPIATELRDAVAALRRQPPINRLSPESAHIERSALLDRIARLARDVERLERAL